MRHSNIYDNPEARPERKTVWLLADSDLNAVAQLVQDGWKADHWSRYGKWRRLELVKDGEVRATTPKPREGRRLG